MLIGMKRGSDMEKWEELLDEIKLPEPDDDVYIWGAGNTAVLAHQGMVREGLYDTLRVKGYIDGKLSGTTVNGFPVYSPDEILKNSNIYILICIRFMIFIIFIKIIIVIY